MTAKSSPIFKLQNETGRIQRVFFKIHDRSATELAERQPQQSGLIDSPLSTKHVIWGVGKVADKLAHNMRKISPKLEAQLYS